nr:MAG: hypothetical protein [Bacteriophage sp.]
MAKEGCDKNCATCDIGNRAYCAVQLGLKNQELLMNMQTIISGLIQVLTPILTPGSAPIQSPNLGGDVPAEDIKISLLAFKKAFTVLADVNPRMAKEVLECYEGTLKYYNFLTENEAEEIVAAFQNQDGSKGPKWRDPDELFEKVEQHDGRVECEPYYNKWALYVAMNKAASDQNSVILKWIGDDKDKYIIACYDLALTDLKDKDRPYWIRKYFHVESKF